ncbi:glycoside hydrolase family 16 protein [Arthrobacter pascens]|uniref:glycoside hydrolase family 16 protein n=1 Tax=Arthrobacter pascens TaxID=1677 RepID=UPI0027D8E03A|nr:glycoside hydrolase family 16 protein [Arthrobacter pascens]
MSSAAASPAPTASGSGPAPAAEAATPPKPVTPPPAPAPAPAAAPAPALPAAGQALATTGDGAQAATAFGWGPVLTGDEFSNTGAPDRTKWSVYNSAGHAGKGVRSPQAWSVANGVATVRGDAAGTTGGMSAKFAQQKYGRWETRMRTDARDPKYHPVLILNNNAAPNCAEIDYAEGSKDAAFMRFFLHYACDGADFQTTAATRLDSTQWHNYAVEWTPAAITGYVDGVKTFTDTNPAHQPSVAMKQTLQLDWFPDGSATKPSQMQVDWVRVYG